MWWMFFDVVFAWLTGQLLSPLRAFCHSVLSSCAEPAAKMLAISSKACSAGEEKLEPCSFFTLEQRMKSEDVQ